MNSKTPLKRKIDKRVQQCISVQTCMEHAGSDVLLNISSKSLEIKSLDSNEVIARHDMPRISFASGGDGVRLKRKVSGNLT
jgi:SHC-transforming protein 1